MALIHSLSRGFTIRAAATTVVAARATRARVAPAGIRAVRTTRSSPFAPAAAGRAANVRASGFRFRAISTDPEKCPGGRVSWKRNRNHLGRDLRDGLKQRQFNEALALLAETEGRLIEKDPPVWQR